MFDAEGNDIVEFIESSIELHKSQQQEIKKLAAELKKSKDALYRCEQRASQLEKNLTKIASVKPSVFSENEAKQFVDKMYDVGIVDKSSVPSMYKKFASDKEFICKMLNNLIDSASCGALVKQGSAKTLTTTTNNYKDDNVINYDDVVKAENTELLRKLGCIKDA